MHLVRQYLWGKIFAAAGHIHIASHKSFYGTRNTKEARSTWVLLRVAVVIIAFDGSAVSVLYAAPLLRLASEIAPAWIAVYLGEFLKSWVFPRPVGLSPRARALVGHATLPDKT